VPLSCGANLSFALGVLRCSALAQNSLSQRLFVDKDYIWASEHCQRKSVAAQATDNAGIASAPTCLAMTSWRRVIASEARQSLLVGGLEEVRVRQKEQGDCLNRGGQGELGN
jgi:hypothetical protein